MKQFVIASIFVAGAFFPSYSYRQPARGCQPDVSINAAYSQARALDSILKYYSANYLPGAALAVYTEKEGWWAGAQGFANREKKIPLQTCHLQYLQSVSKTYMAVGILQLKEKGKIRLDDPMTNYLPLKYSRHIKDADKVTIRMLLNHRSGVPEYNQEPSFVSDVILHPLKNFTAEQCLRAISRKDFQFAPGTRYLYTNTNYLLLALIGDAITGDHAAHIRKNIFQPLGLKNSFYGKDFNYLKGLNLPESYWDVFNSGVPVNVTPFQQMTVACSKGDDGIVCSVTDAVRFMKGLMEGKLLNAESMKEMFDFVTDEKGYKRYGMGIIYFDMAGTPAYGHGGGGIGAGCGLVYIPSRQTYVFLATNLGVFVDSNLSATAAEMRDAVLATLLK